MLSYNKNLFGKLFTSATAGSTIEANNGDNTSYSSVGYYSANLSHPAFAAGYVNGKPGGSDNIYRTVGFFANLNSIWDNKYFLDFIYRYEGSSKFGKNTRFAPLECRFGLEYPQRIFPQRQRHRVAQTARQVSVIWVTSLLNPIKPSLPTTMQRAITM